MANRTVKDATTIKGTNPQYLIEKVIRTRIYDSKYWKEQCFALTAELLVDKAMELRYIGGTFAGNIKPTPFLCLDFKYVRALGAFYLRLVGSSLDCYKYLEPLLNDYRKIRVQDKQGKFNLSHMDEFVDTLLREERLCDTILPRIQIRSILEETQNLEPRVSILDEDLDEEIEESSSEEEEGILKDDEGDTKKHKSKRRRDSSSERYKSSRRRRRSRSVSRDRRRNRSRSRSRSPRRHDRRRDERSHHRRKESSQKSSSSNSYKSKGGADEMSIEETNKLRISLGLNPLK
ncbi:PRPF38A [Lepeophtheirus salmonis]|uniref:Pre-mRNA-splicing factor 38 n=1 Tax=Lepeophtheirus salmonis TaxID=72036 RepID=A0A7R8CYG7_LEPSM|nr:PRPF38A [Lepeophtheirus salmonis]CAF2969491.1 PRPF38A [Lepeophtheirus salmonis]